VTRKLSEAERDEIVRIACSEEYCDQTPYEIVVDLLEKRNYFASASTFYRILRERGLVHHYAYVILDVWSHKIVGWEIHERESPELASDLFLRLSRSCNLNGLHLHSDNGTAMKAATMLMTFYRLGVMPSFSRPRVSDDNPYSESLFKTMKYHVEYPRNFADIGTARSWLAGFVDWYNTQHRHSRIGYVTPQSRHEGSDLALFDIRNETVKASRTQHPERWGKKFHVHCADRSVYLNPIPEKRTT
jgi:hypothetical protein